MNLGVVFDVNMNKPELVLVHDYLTGNIGYSTYNSNMSTLINTLLNSEIYSEILNNDSIIYSLCEKTNSYYLNALNNYLPSPFKILWIKKVEGDINNILEESYEILEESEV